MSEDPRCCGSGACIVDNEGRCWCGHQWDGQKMCQVPLEPVPAPEPGRAVTTEPPVLRTGSDS
jgi:hypothetical protein